MKLTRKNRIYKRKKNRSRLLKKSRVLKGGSQPFMTIYLMCFNEEYLIDFTVNYYKRQFPNCKIIICDNESNDKSVEIAKGLGCEIYSYNTGGAYSEEKLIETKNTVWKSAKTPWIIVCDMDEFLTANQNTIKDEDAKGTTILKTKGYEIYGDSTKSDLSNIKAENRLDKLTKGEYSDGFSKKICFNREKITDINFGAGAHSADPKGDIKYSEKEYLIYHYKKLGKEYYKYTHDRVYARVKYSRDNDIIVGSHYTNDNAKIEEAISTDNKSIETVPALETYYINYNLKGGTNVSIPIIIYSHSDVFDVLKIQLDYFKKLFNNSDQVIYLLSNTPYNYISDTNNTNFKYETILYDDTLPYFSRLLYCIQKIDSPYFIITHENDILIKFDKDAIYKMVDMMKNKQIDSINIQHPKVNPAINYTPEIQITDTLFISKMKDNDNYVFSVQPRIWNKESAIKLFSNYTNKTYKNSESANVQQYMKTQQNTYITYSNNYMIALFPGDVIPEYCYLHITTHSLFFEYDKDSKIDPVLKEEHRIIFDKYIKNGKRGYKI